MPWNEWLTISLVFLALISAYQSGFVFGEKNRKVKEEKHLTLISNIQMGLLSLLGVMLAFSFSLSSTRFENRRQLIIQESMSIGTSYFRAGLLPDTLRVDLRSLLRDYLNMRISFYKPGNSVTDMKNIQKKSEQIQIKIWYKTAVIGKKYPTLNTNITILALNSMIDISGNISSSFQNHVPRFVLMLLTFVALSTILTIGYCHGFSLDRNLIFVIVLSTVICSILLLIIDMDRPTTGFLKADIYSLTELKNVIKSLSDN